MRAERGLNEWREEKKRRGSNDRQLDETERGQEREMEKQKGKREEEVSGARELLALCALLIGQAASEAQRAAHLI